MLKINTIARFDRVGVIASPTISTTSGVEVRIYASEYTDVSAKEVKASGSESSEENQVVGREKRAFVIRKFDRTVTNKMIWQMDGENYHITSVHPYGSDRRCIVLECESLDND